MESHQRGIRVPSDLKKGSLPEAGLARVEQDVGTATLAAPASMGKQRQSRVKGTSPLARPEFRKKQHTWGHAGPWHTLSYWIPGL